MNHEPDVASPAHVTTAMQTIAVSPLPLADPKPYFMIGSLVLGDAVSLSIAGLIALLTKRLFWGVHELSGYFVLAPFLLLFVLVYAGLGLYGGVALSPPQELRRLTFASILVTICVALITFSFRGTEEYFTRTMAIASLASIVLLPLMRVVIRMQLARCSWWGYPTILFGDRPQTALVAHTLASNLGLGLRPIAIVDSDLVSERATSSIRVIRDADLVPLVKSFGCRTYAVVSSSPENAGYLSQLVDRHRSLFPHVLFIPHNWDYSHSWVASRELGGLLGFEIQDHVFQWHKRILKRTVDLLLTGVIAALIAPLLLIVAVFIRLDSAGPVFYSHRRIGRGGKEFRAWKFRSMRQDADAVLANYLEQNPALQSEWLHAQKLRDDPRVTRVGRVLRRSSLDELPQLWNVLKGEMSLVGPRPIVQEEVARYGDRFAVYARVPGGLTGLWQVSGRSDTSYEQRVHLDTFYIRNWSVWLDFCILFRTIGAVLSRAGAF